MILFFSDIHGKIDNFDKINFNKYEEIFFLGDIYGEYDSDEKVKNFFQKYQNKLVCIKGNCDNKQDYESLGYYPNEIIHFVKDGINIYCNHGMKYRSRYLSNFENMDVLIYGHEHVPYIKKIEDRVYICVGSVSFPRDSNGPSYLEYDKNVFTLRSINGDLIDQIDIKKQVE